MRVRRIFLLLFILCLFGCTAQSKVKDPSIVGVYKFSHMFFREGFSSMYEDTEDVSNREQSEQRYLTTTPGRLQMSASAFCFNENGTFSRYYPHSGEVLESGVYTYDGKQLKLYTSDKKYIYNKTIVVDFRLDGIMLFMDFSDSELGESAVFLYDKILSECSSSEAQ